MKVNAFYQLDRTSKVANDILQGVISIRCKVRNSHVHANRFAMNLILSNLKLRIDLNFATKKYTINCQRNSHFSLHSSSLFEADYHSHVILFSKLSVPIRNAAASKEHPY